MEALAANSTACPRRKTHVMTRFALIIVVSTVIGLASATRLGLFGLVAVSLAFLAILVATRADHEIGVAGLAGAMVVLQVSYVLGGWLCQPLLRRLPTTGCGAEGAPVKDE